MQNRDSLVIPYVDIHYAIQRSCITKSTSPFVLCPGYLFAQVFLLCGVKEYSIATYAK